MRNEQACGPVARLAVVGGGPAAKALLFAIAQAVALDRGQWRGAQIIIFERSSEFATGLPWSRAQALPEHLSSLASAQPRVVYGDGQRVQFAGCISLLSELGVAVLLRPRCEIVALETEAGNGWRLRDADGARYRADSVVLATGHWMRQRALLPGALRPWPALALQSATAHARQVIVLGTSLTAIDVALTLAAAAGTFDLQLDGSINYRVHRPLGVTLVSRSGCLPAVWGGRPQPWPAFECEFASRLDALLRQGNLSLGTALDALAESCHEVGGGGLGMLEMRGVSLRRRMRYVAALQRVRARDPLATLRRDIGKAADAAEMVPARTLCRQRTLLAALPLLSERFPYLCGNDYHCFETHLRSALYRHAMPMELSTARRITALAQAGVLSVQPLDAADLHGRASGGWVGRNASGLVIEGDLLVDALGQPTDPAVADSALLQSIMRNGHARQPRRACRAGGFVVGAGIDVDSATNRVRSDSARPPLYAMGVLALGTFLDAQGIGQLMRDAERIVGDLSRPPAPIANTNLMMSDTP